MAQECRCGEFDRFQFVRLHSLYPKGARRDNLAPFHLVFVNVQLEQTQTKNRQYLKFTIEYCGQCVVKYSLENYELQKPEVV